jgi:hypothetical protein
MAQACATAVKQIDKQRSAASIISSSPTEGISNAKEALVFETLVSFDGGTAEVAQDPIILANNSASHPSAGSSMTRKRLSNSKIDEIAMSDLLEEANEALQHAVYLDRTFKLPPPVEQLLQDLNSKKPSLRTERKEDLS